VQYLCQTLIKRFVKELHLYLYGEIAPDPGPSNAWGIFGVNWLVSSLNSMPDAQHIILHINSPGGDVIEGFAMYDVLTNEKLKGKVITTIGEGRVASIATVVMLAGTDRKMNKHTKFLIHNPWQDGYAGDAAHFRDIADTLELTQTMLAVFYQEHTGQAEDVLLAHMAKDKYMSAEEAYGLGFITEVLEVPLEAKAFISTITNSMTIIERMHAAMKAFKGDAKNADFATADGETLQIDTAGTEPAVGDSVSIGGQPAPDKAYKLADGKTLVVVAGKIAEVQPAAAPAAVAAPAQTPAPAVVPAATAVAMQAMADALTEVSATVGTLKSNFEAMQNSTTATLESMAGAVELFGQVNVSAGFKNSVGKTKLGEEGERTTMTAEDIKANAIKAARVRAGLDKTKTK
jgi:ATP-dependent Clp endopeptidase proteolytic subunit ClpP